MSPMVIKIVAVVILLVAIVVTALLTKTISIKRYQEASIIERGSSGQKIGSLREEGIQIKCERCGFGSS